MLSFDDEEFGFGTQQVEAAEPPASEETLRQVDTPHQERRARVSSDVETILFKANLYRQFLNNGSIFDGDESEATREVEEEFAQFAEDRLQTLLGLKQPVAVQQQQFDPAEVEVLKMVVRRMVEKQVVTKPNKPAPAPARVVPESQTPTLRKTKLAPRQKPAPQPTKSTKPAAPTQSVATPTPTPPKPAQRSNPEEAYKDGAEVDEEGKRYKITWLAIGDVSPELRKAASNIADGNNIETGNGTLVRQGDSFFKVLKRELRKNVRPPGAKQMPSFREMERISAEQAATAEAIAKGIG